MACYRNGGCGPYEMYSCSECPASKPEYIKRGKSQPYKTIDLNDGQKYVVIYNHSVPINSIRHIVVHNGEYDEEKFKAWYYKTYEKLYNDQFKCCQSTQEMHDVVAELTKERKELDAKTVQESRKKCKFCALGQCVVLPNKHGVSVQCNIGSGIGMMPKVMSEDDVCDNWRDEDEEEPD